MPEAHVDTVAAEVLAFVDDLHAFLDGGAAEADESVARLASSSPSSSSSSSSPASPFDHGAASPHVLTDGMTSIGMQVPSERAWQALLLDEMQEQGDTVERGDSVRRAARSNRAHSDRSRTRSRSKTQAPKQKKRQRDELLCLRAKVAELERDLELLATGSSAAVDMSTAHVGGDCSKSTPSEWQSAAKLEMQAAARAKLENGKLKKRAEEQLAFARSLEKMLAKRQVWGELARSKKYCLVPTKVDRKDCEIYKLLRKSVNARVASTDDVFRAHGLVDLNAVALRSEAGVVLNGEQSLCIEFIDASIMPFDYRAAAQVIWTQIMSKELNINNQLAQVSATVPICFSKLQY